MHGINQDQILYLQPGEVGMAKWLLVLLTLCAASAWAQAAPSESVPLKRVAPISETDRQIQILQAHVREAPGDYAGYDGLGSAFLQKARETGDIAYYDLAEQTLKSALTLAPQDFRAADPLVHLASVYMGEHRFSDALACAQKAIGTGSGNLAPFAIEGDAYTDMGDYDEAVTAYNTVQSLGRVISSPLALAYMNDSRMAYLSFLRGDSAEAIRLMKGYCSCASNQCSPRKSRMALFRTGRAVLSNRRSGECWFVVSVRHNGRSSSLSLPGGTGEGSGCAREARRIHSALSTIDCHHSFSHVRR